MVMLAVKPAAFVWVVVVFAENPLPKSLQYMAGCVFEWGEPPPNTEVL